MEPGGGSHVVLVTRPLGQAVGLVATLLESGFSAIEFPALSIGKVEDEAPLLEALATLERYALVVFVSPNAIDSVLAHLKVDWPEKVAIGVMGPGSAAKLAERGIAAPRYRVFSPAHGHEARFDSESLYEALDIGSLRGRRCVVFRGNGGRGWLIDTLVQNGVKVDVVQSYRRGLGQPSTGALEKVRALVAKKDPATLIVTSSEALNALKDQFRNMASEEGVSWLMRQKIVASHARVAENATAAGFARVVLAEPGDDALVRALEWPA